MPNEAAEATAGTGQVPPPNLSFPMVDPDPSNNAAPAPNAESKPWWRSTTLQGLAVMVVTLILQHAKVDVPGLDGDVSDLVDLLFQIIGAVMVAIGRVRASERLTTGASAVAN